MRETTAGESKTAVAWYHPEQLGTPERSRARCGSLERTHEEWRKLADKTILDLVIDAPKPVKVYVDIEELIAWCRAEGRPIDGRARAAFAAMKLQKQTLGNWQISDSALANAGESYVRRSFVK
jgi:hypothetical protein